MIKKCLTLIFAFILLPVIVFSQGYLNITPKSNTNCKVNKNSPAFNGDYLNNKSCSEMNTQAGEGMIFTNYDFPSNEVTQPMLYMYDIDNDGQKNPLSTAMQRLTGENRHLMFMYGGSAGFDAFSVWPEELNYGFGGIQAAEQGPLAGKAILMGHHDDSSWMATVDLDSLTVNRLPNSFGGNFPAFTYLPDGTIWAVTDGSAIFKSENQGLTFSGAGHVGDSDPAYWSNLNKGVSIQNSPDGQVISIIGTVTREGDAGLGSAPDDSGDVAYWYYSTNHGAAWTGEVIGIDGVPGQIVNRPNYAPLFENFGQIQSVVDNNGVVHAVCNGMSWFDKKDSEIIFAFPVLYWNSRDKQWTAISQQEVDESNWEILVNEFPGNCIGQAYPSIGISEDGENIFVAWSIPEFSGETGKSDINIYPADDDANSNDFYYHDLAYTISKDGGLSWANPEILIAEKQTAEYYPYVADKLEMDGNEIRAHFIYMIDPLPGASLFSSQNSSTDSCLWIYDSITLTIPTYVEKQNSTVNKFELHQNYPNPFNPLTTIKYNLLHSRHVTLEVYNILGQKVKTLVNTKQEMGLHTVVWDAKDNFDRKAASGIYIYQLSVGGYIFSKKMTLLK